MTPYLIDISHIEAHIDYLRAIAKPSTAPRLTTEVLIITIMDLIICMESLKQELIPLRWEAEQQKRKATLVAQTGQ